MELLELVGVESRFSGKIYLSRHCVTVTTGRLSRMVPYGRDGYDFWMHVFGTRQLHFKNGLYRGQVVKIQGLLDGKPLAVFERENPLFDALNQESIVAV